MPCTSMPKTAVHKNNEALPPKYKVWLARQCSVPTPSRNAMGAEECDKLYLGRSVAS
jgi:hypothetical protein